MSGDVNHSEYFTSYEDLEVHKLMLDDTSRTEAYRKAILNNSNYLKDKIVMDVGCGTGILSIFCAQAGAKKVYAVEASNLAILAREIVKENSFGDVIEVIHSKVEDVVLPNNIKVDAIISEWMGFYLLHEGMLDSVLFARDKFLKEGGEMFPETAAIYCAPCSVPSMYDMWKNVYGISMGTFGKYLRESKGNKPDISDVVREDLLAKESCLAWINLREDETSDLDAYTTEFIEGATKAGLYQGICLWFEVSFPNIDKENEAVLLSTAPGSPSTHWKQTLIVLPQELEIEQGEPIAFQLNMIRNADDSRRYNLQVTMLDPDAIEHPHPCSCDKTKCILIRTLLNNQFANKGILEDDEIL